MFVQYLTVSRSVQSQILCKYSVSWNTVYDMLSSGIHIPQLSLFNRLPQLRLFTVQYCSYTGMDLHICLLLTVPSLNLFSSLSQYLFFLTVLAQSLTFSISARFSCTIVFVQSLFFLIFSSCESPSLAFSNSVPPSPGFVLTVCHPRWLLFFLNSCIFFLHKIVVSLFCLNILKP